MARIINQLPLTSNNIWFYPGAPGTKGLRFPCAGNLCFISCENAGRKRGNYADIFTGKTRGWNTGCSGENQNLHKVMQRHLRKQSKVILVTKDKGKCVFPARRTMPRKEASANPGCPMVYHITIHITILYLKVCNDSPFLWCLNINIFR